MILVLYGLNGLDVIDSLNLRLFDCTIDLVYEVHIFHFIVCDFVDMGFGHFKMQTYPTAKNLGEGLPYS